MEELIKEIIGLVPGIDWSPGMYPKSLADIATTPAGSWTVAENSTGFDCAGKSTVTEVAINITLWAGDAPVRSAAKTAVSAAFNQVGFEEKPPANTEIKLPNDEIAFMVALVFHGYVDNKTYWVYKSIN